MSSGRSRSAGHRNTAASDRDDHKTSINNGISIEQLGFSSSLRSVITALFGLFISYTWLKFGIESSQTLQSRGILAIQPTLVIYVYSNSDPEYLKNLEFFIREAIKPNDGCDYVIVLQQNAPEDLLWPSNSLLNATAAATTAYENFPLLPPNARFLLHPNECYDLGTVGWVLQTQIKNISKYKYFIWLNSSVRGPFLPPFLRNTFHWTRPFTSKLASSLTKKAGQVKLVGSTINCGGAQGLPPQPHVQSYISATDAIGLKILQAASGVFSCWEKMADVVVNSEIGASKAIFDAGYSIDCLMGRYQGFNWFEYYQLGLENNKNSSGFEVENSPLLPCNEGLNPLQPDFNDGIDVNIYEVLFIKVKDSFLKSDGWRSAVAAATTARWIEETDTGGAVLVDSVQRNTWLEQGVAEKVILDAKKRGRKCFDVDFYLTANEYDLGFFRKLKNSEEEAWNQFIEMGVYEGRPHRWLC
jgi:hypothetical protein